MQTDVQFREMTTLQMGDPRVSRRTTVASLGIVAVLILIAGVWIGGRAQDAAETTRLLEHLGIDGAVTVADVGAGDGDLIETLASMLPRGSQLYATEIDENQLAALHERAERSRLPLYVLASSAEDARLPADCCDVVILRTVYHHLTQPEPFIRTLARAVKAGGRLVIVDFPPGPGSPVPDGVRDDREGHGVPPTVVKAELTAAGFVLEHETMRFNGRHYLLVFRDPR